MENLNHIQEKIFSIIETGNTNTVIYRLDRDLTASSLKYTIEKLDYTIEYSVDDKKKRTFFINDLQPDGNPILIFTFVDNKIIVNSGIVDDKKIRVSKKTIPIKTKVFYNEDEDIFSEFIITEDIKRQIAFIDLGTLEEVIPVLYFDEDTNQVKGKFKLEADKTYFEFELINEKI